MSHGDGVKRESVEDNNLVVRNDISSPSFDLAASFYDFSVILPLANWGLTQKDNDEKTTLIVRHGFSNTT